jgi:hypothetical protein
VSLLSTSQAFLGFSLRGVSLGGNFPPIAKANS